MVCLSRTDTIGVDTDTNKRQIAALLEVVNSIANNVSKLTDALSTRQNTPVTPIATSTPVRQDAIFSGIPPQQLFASPMPANNTINTTTQLESGDINDRVDTDAATGRKWIVPGFIIRARQQHNLNVSEDEKKQFLKLNLPKLHKDNTNSLIDFLTGINLNFRVCYTNPKIGIRCLTNNLNKFFRPMIVSYVSQTYVDWDKFIANSGDNFETPQLNQEQ